LERKPKNTCKQNRVFVKEGYCDWKRLYFLTLPPSIGGEYNGVCNCVPDSGGPQAPQKSGLLSSFEDFVYTMPGPIPSWQKY